jgi:hypothetical protein
MEHCGAIGVFFPGLDELSNKAVRVQAFADDQGA